MTFPDKNPKIYHAHRDNQRERILEVAEALFIKQGIDNVSVTDIALAARLSRVTLYEYFPDKQEIAWAVFRKVIEKLHQDTLAGMDQVRGNGYQKLEWLLERRADSLEKHYEHLRFIAIFNFLYARDGSPKRMLGTLNQAWPGGYEQPEEMIRAGIADGSIRSDLDAKLLSAVINNLFASLASRFSLLGENIQEEFGYDITALFRETCRVFLQGIRSAG